MKLHQFRKVARQFYLQVAALLFSIAGLQAQTLPGFPVQSFRVNSGEKAVPANKILKDFFPQCTNQFSLIELKHSNKGLFRRFQLCYQGYPLHNFLITEFISAAGNNRHYFIPDVPLDNMPVVKSPCTLVYNGSFWEALQPTVFTSGSPVRSEISFYDLESNVRFSEDWLLRFSDTARVRGRVFRPDPVSRLQLTYGGILRDRSDSSSSLLRAAMDSIRIAVSFEGDSFRLENDFVKLGEFSPPFSRRAVSASADSFWFDRDDPRFEEFNIYYHISSYREFLKSLGFDSLARFPVQADAHGMDGADQSAYSPLQGFLAFGDGNVDDSEDAAVIIHEYGHVLCHAAFPFGNSGQERRSVEEGICDYLAGSYLRALSTFMPDRIFRWDGNNEFWPGRSLLSTANYPNDLSGSFYADGGIFCSALLKLEESIGRNTVHKLLLTSLSGLGPNLHMPAAARLLLLSDSALFQGQHSVQIRERFLQRGIDPGQVVVSAVQKENTVNEIVFNEEMLPFFLVRTPVSTAELLDIRGVVVRKISFPGKGLHEIPANWLQPGLYFLRTGNQTFRIPVSGN